ncbi:hypothetical protein IMG5_001370 [Ichthyophthirius multifiliis]|uniref:Transmembrane protein n=1 Tax=Ichthyophthirius multifiliis TaxID=5932 RepID=G0QIS9_ICHMU|nr:hypothetical protein IMG5_001370 [Ichthyophthirius multifiliis]EGR34908.1 hypothetical protein IMG5_001370 [Ichthyophthirius multifiliis]|eukprot:XP_004040212.1 hypothetical protein IMG5_001370 [Ichthyophthirius multifiliis]
MLYILWLKRLFDIFQYLFKLCILFCLLLQGFIQLKYFLLHLLLLLYLLKIFFYSIFFYQSIKAFSFSQIFSQFSSVSLICISSFINAKSASSITSYFILDPSYKLQICGFMLRSSTDKPKSQFTNKLQISFTSAFNVLDFVCLSGSNQQYNVFGYATGGNGICISNLKL